MKIRILKHMLRSDGVTYHRGDIAELPDGLARSLLQEYPDEFKMWHENWIDYQIPDGESAAMVQKRINETMDKIISENDNKRVLVVTHLGAARHIISYLLGLTTEESWCFTLDNAGVAVIQIKEGKGLLKGLNI